MTLEAGTQLGPYRIDGPAGAGGMGEVYKATDTRLQRTVAVKVLHTRVASNPDLKERFEREAKVIAGLNHPNICTLHDIGSAPQSDSAGEIDYLVMEYIEGESLSSRLEKGPLSAGEILNIAIQISDALDKAHKQGLVHRDLKPGNIMLTREGAKLLDFGLAKFQPQAGFVDDLSSGQTRTTPLTMQGAIIGTLQYMAPEQLEGQEADSRSDIFAFGATLYEMATGKTAFEGKSRASLIASVLKEQPRPVSEITPLTPAPLESVISQCLAKEPDQRWQSAGDLKRSLELIRSGGALPGLSRAGAGGKSVRLAWAVAAVAVLVAVVIGAQSLMTEAPSTPVRRLMIPFGNELSGIYWPRLSPDGKLMVFCANDSLGTSRIWVRPLNSLTPYPLQGTEGIGRRPFWSPDSRFVAYMLNQQLKKSPVDGGPAQTICRSGNASDGSWGSSNIILFDGGLGDSLNQVSAAGGEVSPATVIQRDKSEQYHGWPWFLPNGKDFIFVVGDSLSNPNGDLLLKVGSLENEDTKTLGRVDSRVEYTPGYLLYVRDRIFVARPFDPDKKEFTGEPIPLDDEVSVVNLGSNFSASDDGTLAYQKGATQQRNLLLWVDRTGKALDTIGGPDLYGDISLSPDGSRLAYEVMNQQLGTIDIWVRDLRRDVPSRLTFDDGDEVCPMWSPDGKYIYFTTNRGGRSEIARRQASGIGGVDQVYSPDSISWVIAGAWAPDGKTFLVNQNAGKSKIVAVDTDSGVKTDVLSNEEFNNFTTSVTADGRYLVYGSDESGGWQTFVRELSETGGKWQISVTGGSEPRWRTDGRELFFVSGDDDMMSTSIDFTNGFQAGVPQKLFHLPLDFRGWERNRFEVSADGQKFLVNVRGGNDQGGEFVIVLNWSEGIKNK